MKNNLDEQIEWFINNPQGALQANISSIKKPIQSNAETKNSFTQLKNTNINYHDKVQIILSRN